MNAGTHDGLVPATCKQCLANPGSGCPAVPIIFGGAGSASMNAADTVPAT